MPSFNGEKEKNAQVNGSETDETEHVRPQDKQVPAENKAGVTAPLPGEKRPDSKQSLTGGDDVAKQSRQKGA